MSLLSIVCLRFTNQAVCARLVTLVKRSSKDKIVKWNLAALGLRHNVRARIYIGAVTSAKIAVIICAAAALVALLLY